MGEWMDYGDYYWGLYRAYYKDPFPRSLLSTRQKNVLRGPGAEDDARPRRLLRLGQISRQLELGSWFRGGWGGGGGGTQVWLEGVGDRVSFMFRGLWRFLTL